MLPRSGYSIIATGNETKTHPAPNSYTYTETHTYWMTPNLCLFTTQGPRRPFQKVEFDELVPSLF